jgi:hypothetical protein
MRGIARSGLFKSHGLDRSYGPPTASLPSGNLPSGMDPDIIPVVVGVNAILYNPKNLGFGSVTPPANISSALRSNLINIAKNSIKPPSVLVVFTVYYNIDTQLFASVVYSRYPDFPASEVREKYLRVSSGSSVTFSLTDLIPGATYYIKAKARSVATGINSLPSPSTPIVINTPVAPTNGVFGGGYYINGQITGLSVNGTGEYNNTYYIKGQPTSLVEISENCWSGTHQGLQYFCGVLADGLINGSWWKQGSPSSEVFYNGGNGVFNGIFYQNYSPFTGNYNFTWYSMGVAYPTLNYAGSGFIGQTAYQNGLPYTGNLDGQYYVNGQLTSLASTGTGVWNGQYYSSGVYIGSVGNPYDAGQTSSMGSRFSEGVTYG